MPIKLKFANITRPTAAALRQRSPRDVVVQALDEQIALAEATMRGEPFQVSRQRYRKNAEGETKKVTVSSRPRPWWFQADNRFFAEVKYGNAVVDLSGQGMTTFEVGAKLDDVLKLFRQLREAVAAGDYDAQIAAAKAQAARKVA